MKSASLRRRALTRSSAGAVAALIAASTLAACTSAPPDCLVLCRRVGEVCGTYPPGASPFRDPPGSCAVDCGNNDALVGDTGCRVEYDAWLACSEADWLACREHRCGLESDRVSACITAYCRSNPTSVHCGGTPGPTCASLCAEIGASCGTYPPGSSPFRAPPESCDVDCADFDALVASGGCRSLADAYLSCSADQWRACAESTCSGERDALNACVRAHCDANPDDPAC